MKLLRSALTFGLPFAVAMTLLLSILVGPGRALAAGPIAGLLFGVLLAGFVAAQRRSMEVTGGLLDGERVLHQGPANHRIGAEMRGGWLVLTERALHFRPHDMNANKSPVRLELRAVRAFAEARTMGLIANAIALEQGDGAVTQFVVQDRKEWLRQLAAALPQRSVG